MTDNDAARKAAILKRLREMLLRQREKLRSYLEILELESASIAEGDVERLSSQVELEKMVISEIRTLARVIRPLEDLYRAAYPAREDTVPALQAAVVRLGMQVRERNVRNRAALKEKMEELRREIAGLRAWPRAGAFAEAEPSLVDITT
jgi:flagellar biosynthesis/type III secretory pathway chaperone